MELQYCTEFLVVSSHPMLSLTHLRLTSVDFLKNWEDFANIDKLGLVNTMKSFLLVRYTVERLRGNDILGKICQEQN